MRYRTQSRLLARAMHSIRTLFLLFTTLGLFLTTACDSNDNSGPSISGTYETTEFIARTDTGEVDALSRGAFIEMTLQEDSTVENGLLFVPSELTGEDFEGDARIEFGGTWSRSSDSSVTFDHDADTFIRDVEWTYSEEQLRTTEGEVTATLRKEDS